MALNQGLRAPEDQLSNSRQQFIQSLENKKKFEEECAIIIPVLNRLWEEKIFPLTPNNHTDNISNVETDLNRSINWKHYLYNYTPQLLSKAITRLASRLSVVNGETHNSRGEVKNVAAYFKALVQDLRRHEVKLRAYKKKKANDLVRANPGLVPECWTCFGEEGSLTCIRPSHKGRQADASMETLAADLMKSVGGK